MEEDKKRKILKMTELTHVSSERSQ
jgi:hypothetical protein